MAPALRDQTVFAIAILPTPVMNVPDIPFLFGGHDGATLKTDESGLMRELEFIALPETVFNIHETLTMRGSTIYRITTADYPYPSRGGYFIDSRFVTAAAVKPPERIKRLPRKDAVIAKMLAMEGAAYVWGGNYCSGIPQLLDFYRPPSYIVQVEEMLTGWTLRGVDCSGLLYQATDGYTPRNTSSLVSYGESVPIAGLDAEQIAERVGPLDLIVWQGHVVVVIDEHRASESRLYATGERSGVVIRPLRQRLIEIMGEKVPADEWREDPALKRFVIRRWYQTP